MQTETNWEHQWVVIHKFFYLEKKCVARKMNIFVHRALCAIFYQPVQIENLKNVNIKKRKKAERDHLVIYKRNCYSLLILFAWWNNLQSLLQFSSTCLLLFNDDCFFIFFNFFFCDHSCCWWYYKISCR